MTHDTTELRPVIRVKIIVALNRHKEGVEGTSPRHLLNFLEPKMWDLPLRGRPLRQEIGAVIQVMRDEGELSRHRGRWRMSGPADEFRRPPARRKRRRPEKPGVKHDQRRWHGRPDSARRRLDRVPTSTTWAA